ncbi:putative non-LTR retroelement reverse transcriptase, partial [Trifolium medium]|nr:putative non-LTR retroelement reverse transcriptase [Trifolium medium]
MDGEEVWKSVMVAKYGVGVLGRVRLEEMQFGTICSPWWKDLCRLERGVNWFSQVVMKRMGGGNTIKFWKDIWVGDQTLEQRFPRLYGVSVQQE